MAFRDALEEVLCEAGLDRIDARAIQTYLDRRAVPRVGSDDLAGSLLRWRSRCVSEAIVNERLRVEGEKRANLANAQLTFGDTPFRE